jgi:hypothetical protein
MGKRPGKGHDATQEVSGSQLVGSQRPVLNRNNPKNDMSLWAGDVVGISDFAPPVKKPVSQPTKWKWIAGGLALVGAALAAYLIVSSGTKKSAPSANAVTPAPVAIDAGVAATKPEAKDAGVAAVADAATVAAIDAGPTVAVVNGADAISGVAPIIKVAKKKGLRKATPKKAVPKKKPAKKK